MFDEHRSRTGRGRGRFEVRVHATDARGVAYSHVRSRSAKLAVAMLAVLEVGRLWAASDGAVRPGTEVRLVDTTDGGTVILLRFNGFEPNTLDGALNTLRTNGFPTLQEVPDGK